LAAKRATRSARAEKQQSLESLSERTGAVSKTDRLRVRAAWMYYIEQMTQSDIADVLNIGRVSVVRLLAEARQRNEVKIAIEADLADIIDLERQLERTYGLDRAIVAPVAGGANHVSASISAATAEYLSETVTSGMRIGVGWGRTLLGCLQFMQGRQLDDLHVISLLGGIIQARRFNPAEFAWQFAQIFRGDAYLIPAPAVVDSLQTRDALIERCGLKAIFELANQLDMVVLSVGGLNAETTTTFQVGFLTEEQLRSLKASGAVGDILFHFIDKDGRAIDHPLNDLVMSVGLDVLRNTKLRVLTSGGADKIEAMPAAIAAIRPHVLITDELTARRLLKEPAEA
jgi:DNA-binding transcriptional regulator LsrR (DeoR family)